MRYLIENMVLKNTYNIWGKSMCNLKLLKPRELPIEAIIAFRNEYIEYKERTINGTAGLIKYEDIDLWLEMITSVEHETLTKQNVHASTFFAISETDNKIIGSIQLRHTLSPVLEQHGGHIGYSIRPTERGKGYGIKQLQLILEKAREIGIQKVLLTCHKANERSKRTIESCGGVLHSESEYENNIQLNYWINII